MGKTPTKVISFNSNYCNAANFHSWVQWSDPGHEIEWLEKELHELENSWRCRNNALTHSKYPSMRQKLWQEMACTDGPLPTRHQMDNGSSQSHLILEHRKIIVYQATNLHELLSR